MLVNFKYSKNHGTAKKGDSRKMNETTANALAKHNIGATEGKEVKKQESKK